MCLNVGLQRVSGGPNLMFPCLKLKLWTGWVVAVYNVNSNLSNHMCLIFIFNQKRLFFLEELRRSPLILDRSSLEMTFIF